MCSRRFYHKLFIVYVLKKITTRLHLGVPLLGVNTDIKKGSRDNIRILGINDTDWELLKTKIIDLGEEMDLHIQTGT